MVENEGGGRRETLSITRVSLALVGISCVSGLFFCLIFNHTVFFLLLLNLAVIDSDDWTSIKPESMQSTAF